jgi:hypothetical protein
MSVQKNVSSPACCVPKKDEDAGIHEYVENTPAKQHEYRLIAKIGAAID